MNSPLESEPKKKVGVVFEIKEKVAIQAVTDHFLIIYILTRTTVFLNNKILIDSTSHHKHNNISLLWAKDPPN